RPRPGAGDDLRRADQERLGALPSRRQAPGLPQPDRWQRLGGPDEGAPPERLLRQRPARRDVRGLHGSVRHLLRHDRRARLRVGRCRRLVGTNRARPAVGAFRGGPDAGMTRIVLPPHLRTLAKVSGEVELDVPGPATRAVVLDALEESYPVLRGAIRDHVTKQRRPFIRFFACEEDLSHEPADALLPEPVNEGREPFLVVGAIAGG